MALPVNIQFSGIGNPFSNISKMPPYITKSIKPIFNSSFERSEIQYTFNGQLTGLTFSGLKSKVDQLFSNFSAGFYPSITIDTEYSECCQLDSISIDASNYVGIVPYTVQITCHDKTNGLGAKVKNVSREISYQETEDKQLQISQRISADGIRTAISNDALSNARAFVNNLTGKLSDFGPYWNGVSFTTPTLLNQKETINPLDANISIEENYVVGTDAGNSPVLRYTINISSGVEDGNVNLTIDGNVIGGKTYDFSALKSQLANISATNLPAGLNFSDFQVNGENYDYNANVNTLSFSQNYTNDQRITQGISKSYSIDINSDFIEQINKIDYKGDVKPNTNLTFATAKSVFSSSVQNGLTKVNDLLAQTTFLTNIVDKTKLHLTSKGLTIDENNAILSSSESYDDTNSRYNSLVNLDYTVKITPGLDQYSFSPVLDQQGQYVIEDLKYKKRHILAINGSALIDVSVTNIDTFTSSLIVDFANYLRNTYFSAASDLILTKSNISLNKENASCSFDIEFSSETSQYN
jgi:hypothetical protein